MGLELVSHITVTYICYCDLTRKMPVFSFSPKKPAFFLVKHRSLPKCHFYLVTKCPLPIVRLPIVHFYLVTKCPLPIVRLPIVRLPIVHFYLVTKCPVTNCPVTNCGYQLSVTNCPLPKIRPSLQHLTLSGYK